MLSHIKYGGTDQLARRLRDSLKKERPGQTRGPDYRGPKWDYFNGDHTYEKMDNDDGMYVNGEDQPVIQMPPDKNWKDSRNNSHSVFNSSRMQFKSASQCQRAPPPPPPRRESMSSLPPPPPSRSTPNTLTRINESRPMPPPPMPPSMNGPPPAYRPSPGPVGVRTGPPPPGPPPPGPPPPGPPPPGPSPMSLHSSAPPPPPAPGATNQPKFFSSQRSNLLSEIEAGTKLRKVNTAPRPTSTSSSVFASDGGDLMADLGNMLDKIRKDINPSDDENQSDGDSWDDE